MILGIVRYWLLALLLATGLGVAQPAVAAPAVAAPAAAIGSGPLWRQACVLVTPRPVDLAQARRMTGWTCNPGPADFAHDHAWVRLPAPQGPVADAVLLRSDALALASLDVVVELADGTLRQRKFSATDLAHHWSMGTNFAVPLLAPGEGARGVWLRANGPLDRNNAMLASYVGAHAEQVARERGLVLIAVFCGMLVIVAVYALSLSLAMHSPFSMWHGAMVTFLLIYTLSSGSLLNMALPGLSLWQRSATSYLSLGLSIAMMGPFMVTYLEDRMVPPLMARLAYGVSLLPALAGVGFVFLAPYFPFVARPLYHLSYLPGVVCFVAISLMALSRGSVAARIVALAWIVPVIVAVDRILRGVNMYVLPNDWDNAFYAAMALQSIVMAGGITWRVGMLRRERDQAQAQEQLLGRLAETDDLTGLPNRRAFEARVWRQGDFLAIIDADHFKEVNDGHGHHMGDLVLARIGAELALCVAESNACLSAFRLGGEEFAVAVSGRVAAKAAVHVNLLRHRVAAAVSANMPTLGRPLTVSAGMAMIGKGGMKEAYRKADRALYKAKHAGRDRLCYEMDESGTALIFPRPKAA